MNRNIKTLTIIKFLLKRPVTFLRKLLTKIDIVTTIGILGLLFKFVKYTTILFSLLTIVLMYVWDLDLRQYFSLANLLFFSIIGRMYSSFKSALDNINDYLGLEDLKDSESEIKENTELWSKDSIEQIREFKKLEEALKNAPMRSSVIEQVIQDKINNIQEQQDTGTWIGKHPYLTGGIVISIGLITFIWCHTDDGSLGSMYKITSEWFSSGFTAVSGLIIGLNPRARITSEAESPPSNSSNQPINLQEDRTTNDTTRKAFYETRLESNAEGLKILDKKINHYKDILHLKDSSDPVNTKVQDELKGFEKVKSILIKDTLKFEEKLNKISPIFDASQDSSELNSGLQEIVNPSNLPLSPETKSWRDVAQQRDNQTSSGLVTPVTSPTPKASSSLPMQHGDVSPLTLPQATWSEFAQGSSTDSETKSDKFSYPPAPSTVTADEFADEIERKHRKFNPLPENIPLPSSPIDGMNTQLTSQSPLMSTQSALMSSESALISPETPLMSSQSPQLSSQTPQMSSQSPLLTSESLDYFKQSAADDIIEETLNQSYVTKLDILNSLQNWSVEKIKTIIPIDQLLIYVEFAEQNKLTLPNNIVEICKEGGYNLSAIYLFTNLTRDYISDEDLYCLELLETYQLDTILNKVPYKYMIYYRNLFTKLGESVPENLLNAIKIIEAKPLYVMNHLKLYRIFCYATKFNL